MLPVLITALCKLHIAGSDRWCTLTSTNPTLHILYITHNTLLPDLAHKTMPPVYSNICRYRAGDARQKVLPPPLSPISMSSPTSPLCSHPTILKAGTCMMQVASEAVRRNISGPTLPSLCGSQHRKEYSGEKTTSVDQSRLSSCRSFRYSQNVRILWFGNL